MCVIYILSCFTFGKARRSWNAAVGVSHSLHTRTHTLILTLTLNTEPYPLYPAHSVASCCFVLDFLPRGKTQSHDFFPPSPLYLGLSVCRHTTSPGVGLCSLVCVCVFTLVCAAKSCFFVPALEKRRSVGCEMRFLPLRKTQQGDYGAPAYTPEYLGTQIVLLLCKPGR